MGFMKYAVEMGPGAMIYIPSFVKNGSGIQKLIRGYREKQTAWRLHKPTFYFFQNKKGRLKMTNGSEFDSKESGNI
jgi:hypothetical protein